MVILREQGVNGHVEMAQLLGWDVIAYDPFVQLPNVQQSDYSFRQKHAHLY